MRLEHHDSIGSHVEAFDPKGYTNVLVEPGEVECGDFGVKVKLPFSTWIGTIKVRDDVTLIRVWVPACGVPHPVTGSLKNEEEFWGNYERLEKSAEKMYKLRAEEMLREAAVSMKLSIDNARVT